MASTSKRSNKKNNLTEKQVNKCLNYLESFCSSQGWEIEYSADKRRDRDIAIPIDNWNGKIILWNKNRRAEVLYYIFLHELGHLLMRLKDITYAARYSVMLENRYATDTYKILRVQEEMEAWNVGLQFARDHGLKINDRKFQKVKAECLMSYMLWATRRHRKKALVLAEKESKLLKELEKERAANANRLSKDDTTDKPTEQEQPTTSDIN